MAECSVKCPQCDKKFDGVLYAQSLTEETVAGLATSKCGYRISGSFSNEEELAAAVKNAVLESASF